MQNVRTIRCWSGGGPQNKVWNWGDAISPTLYTLLTCEQATVVDYSVLTDEPHLVMCGSTLKWITAGSIVWGTGEIATGMEFMVDGVRPLEVRATRGPLSRARLEAVDISTPAIYGDPALLFPYFYHPTIEPIYRLGVIPHYVDAQLPFISDLARDKEIKIIDITRHGRDEKIFSFVDEVLACQRVVSSSLHGLIVAEAYGIPAIWGSFSDRLYGGAFKFHDYSMSVGRHIDRLLPFGIFSEAREATAAIDQLYARQGPISFDPEPLLKAFPGSRKCGGDR